MGSIKQRGCECAFVCYSEIDNIIDSPHKLREIRTVSDKRKVYGRLLAVKHGTELGEFGHDVHHIYVEIGI